MARSFGLPVKTTPITELFMDTIINEEGKFESVLTPARNTKCKNSVVAKLLTIN